MYFVITGIIYLAVIDATEAARVSERGCFRTASASANVVRDDMPHKVHCTSGNHQALVVLI